MFSENFIEDRLVVGSILTSVNEGQEVERGDELGYFAFGTSFFAGCII